jgi:hypothetical protein
MARTRTVDFLPPIFQTTTNKQFLAATLDQLVQEPQFKKTQGFIGRHVGPGVNPNDYYVIEPTADRANYQLEPGVISLVPDTNTISDAITYPGISDALARQGGITDNSSRLYTSEYYSWDPFINFDKFSNYSQYYWVPAGPLSVDVSATTIPFTDTFDVTRSDNYYEFSGIGGTNPVLTLIRGGTYNFSVNQAPNQFWIQTEPGVNGQLPYSPNISSRGVLGVNNNGEDLGTVTFSVPYKNAQQFYYNLDLIPTIPTPGQVDLLTDLQFEQIDGVNLADFLAQYPTGIDGIVNLENRTLVFSSTAVAPDVWQIQYQTTMSGIIISLKLLLEVPAFNKFTIIFGTQWSNTQWYRNASGYLQQIPLLSAAKDLLWYQDGTNPEIFGQIRLVDQAQAETIDVDTDILGKKNYTAPNGVVFTNNLQITFRGTVTPASYEEQTYYVAGVGTAIQLLPVGDYVTPETYTESATIPFDSLAFDKGTFDGILNQPLQLDYITIALDSPDLNAWTRSNRWFHIDVITAAANYNNTTIVLDNAQRAKRPIIEFRGGIKLYNMGTQSKAPVDIIDLDQTDALSNVNGQTGY